MSSHPSEHEWSQKRALQEFSRRIHRLLVLEGRDHNSDLIGPGLAANVGSISVRLTSTMLVVYVGTKRVYAEDGEGKCTGFLAPDVGYAMHDLQIHMILDDLASI
jgi:hypothetical protein